jgi:hypothetical protein
VLSHGSNASLHSLVPLCDLSKKLQSLGDRLLALANNLLLSRNVQITKLRSKPSKSCNLRHELSIKQGENQHKADKKEKSLMS